MWAVPSRRSATIPRAGSGRWTLGTGDGLGWTGGGADATVRSLALAGSTLYAGGDFGGLDGQSRAFLGAVNTADGVATGFAPDADGAVSVLSASDDGARLVAAGSFGSIGGVAARRLAAIDTATGLADAAWTPNPNDLPRALARSADGAEVLAAGTFTGAGGVLRTNLAALDATGAALPWDPVADGTVYALAAAPAGDVIYAGGSFSHVDGTSQQKLAGIEAATGDVTDFHVNANNRVRSLAAAGDLLYVGGEFTKLGGQTRTSAGAVRISTVHARRHVAARARRDGPRHRAERRPCLSRGRLLTRRWVGSRSRGRRGRRNRDERFRLRDRLAEVPHLRACDRRHDALRGDGWAGRAPARLPPRRDDRVGGDGRRRRAGVHVRRTGSSTSAGTSRAWRTRPAPRWAPPTRRPVGSTGGRPGRTDRSGRWRPIPRRSISGGPSRERPGSRASGTRGSRSAKEGRARTGVRRGPRCRSGRR